MVDKIKNLIDALNELKGQVTFNDEGVRVIEKDKDGNRTTDVFIKLRPVADSDGIERKQFVAREQ